MTLPAEKTAAETMTAKGKADRSATPPVGRPVGCPVGRPVGRLDAKGEGLMILIRHGQSEWNARNLFTGRRDPDLTARGVGEAQDAGRRLAEAGFRPDIVFASSLRRAIRTARLILERCGDVETPLIIDAALDERDYGRLVGLDKGEARRRWGEEKVRSWRRSFDDPPPGGESLKQTLKRVVAFYEASVEPRFAAGDAVLIAAHGNSLRSLIVHLEEVPPDRASHIELETGAPIVYRRRAGRAVRMVER